jgi:hypothetical protein
LQLSSGMVLYLAIGAGVFGLAGIVLAIVALRRRGTVSPASSIAQTLPRRRLAAGSEAPPFTGYQVAVPQTRPARNTRKHGIRPSHSRR